MASGDAPAVDVFDEEEPDLMFEFDADDDLPLSKLVQTVKAKQPPEEQKSKETEDESGITGPRWEKCHFLIKKQ